MTSHFISLLRVYSELIQFTILQKYLGTGCCSSTIKEHRCGFNYKEKKKSKATHQKVILKIPL